MLKRQMERVIKRLNIPMRDEKCLKVLSYYRIRREDAESALREES